MALRIQKLRPYQSFLLARIREGTKPASIANAILTDLKDVLRLGEDGRTLVAEARASQHADLEIAGLHYLVTKRPAWTTDDDLLDQLNHLALVFRHDQQIAIHLSESGYKRSVLACFDDPKYDGLGKLERQSDRILNAAFINGPARTLWMSTVFRRTTLKPDSKILSGVNLRDALDPLTDQSYQVSAARSSPRNPDLPATIGVSPRGSSLWIGTSQNWDHCKQVVTNTLDHLASTKAGRKRSLPFVAIADGDLSHIGQAYDLAIVPPQLLMDDPTVDAEKLQELEHWADHTSFAVEEQKGPDVTVRVKLDREELGLLKLRLAARKQGRIGIEAEPTGGDKLAELAKHCERDEWLRIWFDSGHTLSGDGLFEVQYQDFPFPNFDWHTFHGFDVTKEKPFPKGGKAKDYNPELIGKSDSLFCWTLKHWPLHAGKGDSWLVCDDGSMELADFIHLQNRTLTLIHAKGANADDANRALSVSAYEVVTSQAVKNLRYLEQAHLDTGLAASLDKKVAKAVWRNRRKATREAFLDALRALGSDYERRVVILQPHITKARLKTSKDSTHKTESAQYKQVMTLLNGARTACVGLGAELYVVGHDIAVKGARP